MTHNNVARAKHMAARVQHRAHSEVDQVLAKLRAEAKARGGAFIEEVKDRGSDLLKEAQEQGQKMGRNSGAWIGKNPAQALGTAFIAGMIVRNWLVRKWFSRREV